MRHWRLFKWENEGPHLIFKGSLWLLYGRIGYKVARVDQSRKISHNSRWQMMVVWTRVVAMEWEKSWQIQDIVGGSTYWWIGFWMCGWEKGLEKKIKDESQAFGGSKRVPPFTEIRGTRQNLECGSCLQALLPPSVSCANDTRSFWFHVPSTWG